MRTRRTSAAAAAALPLDDDEPVLSAVGVRTGTQLRSIPMGTVGWAQFREEHPDALVLSRETGHARDYGRNPYVGYDDPGSDPLFPLPEELDGRLPAKARVVGVGTDGDAVAVERSRLATAGAVAVDVGDRLDTLWHLPGQRFGRDAAGAITDEATGSTWNAFGRATDGPLAGQRLRPVVHLDTFWFSWVAFQPDTDLVSP